MIAVFCNWGFARREDGKRGFAITLTSLEGHSLTYIFEEEQLKDLENLMKDIGEFIKLVKGENKVGYA